MSKLADILRRTIRAESAPLGFASGARKAPPSMLLVAFADRDWPKATAEAAGAGADAVLLTKRPKDREVADSVSAAGDRPVGAELDKDGAERLAGLRDAKADFVMLPVGAPAGALLDEDLGYVLRVEGNLTDVQLRTMEGLPISAIYVEASDAPLTIERHIELRRVSGLARKPLLLRVATDATQDDLLSLREAGAVLLAVDMSAGGAKALARLRKLVDELPRRRRPREESRVSLPSGGGIVAHDEGDDEED